MARTVSEFSHLGNADFIAAMDRLIQEESQADMIEDLLEEEQDHG